MFIRSHATICHQPTFRQPGFSVGMKPLGPGSEIFSPDYKEMISAAQRRRMSPVLKMALACALEAIQLAEVAQPEGIIVGSGLGSSTHTQKFLDKIIDTPEGSLISPTSFILSTHNTIAGQISLALKNPHYNTTYTHHSLSFEQAMLDAIMCLEEGANNILVGGADEGPNVLYSLRARVGKSEARATCGTSFFILSEKPQTGDLSLLGCESHSQIKNNFALIHQFLDRHQIVAKGLSLILFSSHQEAFRQELHNQFPQSTCLDISSLVGTYLTSSAFALAYAADYLRHAPPEQRGPILICNHLLPEHLGLMLIAPQTTAS
ncbi:MAG: beta-ketoacyl synthase chain length factor [Bacteroidota bacterium]